MKYEQKIIILLLIAVILAVFAVWHVFLGNKSAPIVEAPVVTAPPPVTPAKTGANLGTQIYQQAQNPIQDKVPSTQNPAVNPIQGIYKNPF